MSDPAGSSEARSTPFHRERPVGRGVAPPSRPIHPVVRTGVVALAVLLCLGVVVHERLSTTFDDGVRMWTIAHRSPASVAFFSFVSTYGSVTPMIIYSAAALLILSLRRRSMLPLIGLISSAAAVLAYLGTKSIVQRTRPSGVGNAFEGTYSFPSAHATTSSAVCCTVAYLLWRERVVSGTVAVLVATVAPFVIGVSRVFLDVHWSTDVIGGWCLGVAIASFAALLYELTSGSASARAATGAVR